MVDILVSMLAILQRRKTVLDAEAAQHLHHVVIMFWRRLTNTEDPVEQVGIGAIEQRLEPPELVVVQSRQGVLGE